MKPIPPSTALRHVYHAVYLQFLLGGIMPIVISEMTDRKELFPGIDARGTAGMMIFMGLNIYCYLRRYEKALAANITNATNAA